MGEQGGGREGAGGEGRLRMGALEGCPRRGALVGCPTRGALYEKDGDAPCPF